MKGDLEYRGYVISRIGCDYIAKPQDDEEFSPDIVGRTLDGLISHVDEMWNALDAKGKVGPAWIQVWLKNPRLHCLHPDEMIASAKRRIRNFKFFFSAVALGGLTATGASAMDLNGDGQINDLDLHGLVHRLVYLKSDLENITRVIAIDGKILEVHLAQTGNPKIDFQVTSIRETW